MANDQKNEQSVMVSIDDILSQDPHLGGGFLQTPLVNDKKEEIDLSALQKIGAAEREDFVAPASVSNIAFQPIQLKEKKASPILSGFLILMGAIGLMIGGIYVGELLNTKLKGNTPIAQNSNQQALNQQGLAVNPQQALINQSNQSNQTNPTNQAVINSNQVQQPADPNQQAAVNPQQTATNQANPNQPSVTANTPNLEKPKVTTTKANKGKAQEKEEKPKEEAKAPVEETKAPVEEAKPKENSEVNNLLKGLKGGKPQGTAATVGATETAKKPESTTGDSGSDSGLPEKLEGRDVLDVIRKNQPNINRCKSFATEATKINVRVTIINSGAVQAAEILDDAHKSSPLGKCLEEKIKSFKFPAFSNPSMSVKLPFNF